MEKFLTGLFAGLLMIAISSIVVAWGYQVFWNDVVLNIWQLFSTDDVINTFRITYGACVAIAFGISLIYSKKADEKLSISGAINKILVKTVSKVIMIGFTLLVTSIVF